MYGDCIRACVASMTDDPNVPHVFDGRKEYLSWMALRNYLNTRKLSISLFTIDSMDDMKTNNYGIPYMLMCSFKNDADHAVVCVNDKIIHDPAFKPNDIDDMNPHSSGFYIVGVITKL